MTDIVQNLINAISAGGLYALYALGIALIFGIMRLVNFAYGELIMVGAYAAVLTASAPVPVVLAAAIAAPVALALAMERIAFRPIRGAAPATLLVTSFALSFVLQSAATVVFGILPKSAALLPGLQGSITVLGISTTQLALVTMGTTLTMLAACGAFLLRTDIGMQMRAAAEDFTTARLMGVRANRVIATAFAVSGVLAGVASFLLVAQTGQASPVMGLTPLLFGFAATVVGGMGSLSGAVLGGYLLAAISTLLQVTLPESLRPYRDAFVFAAVFALLVFRPDGLIVVRTARARV